jgi:hypothetical protein
VVAVGLTAKCPVQRPKHADAPLGI